MKKSEFFACARFLADWPDGCSFHDVLVGVEDGDLAYVVDINYRDWRRSGLSYEIELTEKAFRRAVADLLDPEKTPPEELATYETHKPPQLNHFFKDVESQLAALTIRK